nr:reverse transcriptase domain-containing protein [Tanacetum cinerariifolium]
MDPESRRGIERNETIDSGTFDVNGAKGKGGVDYVSGSCERGHQSSIDDREGWEASARLLRPGKVKFLIVTIDYFTKWIEARPVATVTGTQVKKFVWDNIVCRFGLPGEIVSDNGKQFRDNPFKDWCEKLSIRQCFASVKHPQANGLVERANRSLGEGIKARLDLLEEKREQAAIQEAKNKAKMKGYYNAGFEAPAFVQKTLSTGTTKQDMQKMEESSDLRKVTQKRFKQRLSK